MIGSQCGSGSEERGIGENFLITNSSRLPGEAEKLPNNPANLIIYAESLKNSSLATTTFDLLHSLVTWKGRRGNGVVLTEKWTEKGRGRGRITE
ncbi:hypothetical protein RHMOL_Rhmol09G0158300 [Rhododendron molle]|uniref:Uncharacterized protein n=1 Tax=Rhododendron molle TaxID=49168 RepID=A0ACC0MF87_RHOML|nr:hypothetical protein RHMOL_Rhmol09G0158300 [Rhododendron molle]